jgi:excisionase family DNA binding protein
VRIPFGFGFIIPFVDEVVMYPASLDHVAPPQSFFSDSMTIEEAAHFLRMHPVTLRLKAASGEIPGAKLGKRWVFLRIDLEGYVRSKYASRALQGDSSEHSICHSINAKIPPSGGSSLATMDAEYRKALGLPTR